jgi:beta-lactamase class A
LGLCAINTATGDRIEHRAGARFAMCSTFKWMLAAAILDAADAGRFGGIIVGAWS